MDINAKIDKLEKEIISLKYSIKVQQSILTMRNVPNWAQEAVEFAFEKGIVDETNGASLDFYRLLTTLYKKGLL